MNARADERRERSPKARTLGVVRPDTFDDEAARDQFILQHCKLFPGNGLPDPISADGVAFYDAWCVALMAREITVDDAMEASRRLLLTPPRFAREHLPALIRMAGTIREERDNAERIRRTKAQRPDAEQEMAAYGQIWDRLDAPAQEEIAARVRRRYPRLIGLAGMFRGLCLAEMSNDLEKGRLCLPVDPSADVCPQDFPDDQF